MMNSQRSDTEKINVIEEGKKIGIDEVNKQNEVITMPPYCLKCRKNTKKWIQEFQKLIMVKQWYYQILMTKTLKLKLVIMIEYQNTKTFLLKDKLRLIRRQVFD